MKYRLYVIAVLILLVFLSSQSLSYSPEVTASSARLKELTDQIAKTTDPLKLQELSEEIKKLSQEMTGMDLSIPKTPEEKVSRDTKAINSQYVNLMKNGQGQIPLTRAFPFSGKVVLNGKRRQYSAEPKKLANLWETIDYKTEESFVGYLTQMQTYDFSKKKFVGDPEYWLTSISTGIKLHSFLGYDSKTENGVATRIPILQYKLGKNSYPDGAWDVIQSKMENNKIIININQPEIEFFTQVFNGAEAFESTVGIGEIEFTKESFEKAIKSGKIKETFSDRGQQGLEEYSLDGELTVKFQ